MPVRDNREVSMLRYNASHPPSTINAAEEKIEELVESVQNISAQLGSQDAIDPRTGEEWTHETYNAWRQRALKAQACSIRELKFLKRWVLRERDRYNAKAINVDFDNPKSLIHGAWVVLHSLKSRSVEFTDEELSLIDLLSHYLQHQ